MTPKSWDFNERNTDPDYDFSSYMNNGYSDDDDDDYDDEVGNKNKDDMSKDVSRSQKPFMENNDLMEMSKIGANLLLKE